MGSRNNILFWIANSPKFGGVYIWDLDSLHYKDRGHLQSPVQNSKLEHLCLKFWGYISSGLNLELEVRELKF